MAGERRPAQSFQLSPYDYRAAQAVAGELGIAPIAATVLTRRGYDTPAKARHFLNASESHPPEAFRGMEAARDTVTAAIRDQTPITVFGDFDVDGVCATSILVGTLRRLGAVCDWLIPDRATEGYGLSQAAVERLAQRGTGLLITVDCGITAVEPVAAATTLGIEVLVTDHHQPGPTLPQARILHPEVCGYPFASLCGAAVAWKLSQAVSGAIGTDDGSETESLDLVALATVADLMPLTGENRALVRAGLAVARRGARPGMRALAAAAATQLSSLAESDFSHRLAPRVNAAGRLYRADAGVELFLTEDPDRAQAIAVELDRANRERQLIERQVQAEAESAHRERIGKAGAPAAIVVWGRDWHPGVIGIVASRLVEAHGRPCVVISTGPGAAARGSGRSVPGFDLVGALTVCQRHLSRYGGHRAAAGLELQESEIPAFAESFAQHALRELGPDPVVVSERIDAVVAAADLGLDLIADLERLGPCGIGNPGVNLLVPAARLTDPRTMGEGKHLRFTLNSGGHRAKAVAFGRSSLPVTEEQPADVSLRLERNQWNGTVEPRVLVREIYSPGTDCEPQVCAPSEQEWCQRVEAVLAAGPAPFETTEPAPQAPATDRILRSHKTGITLSLIAELLSSGERVVAVCSDAGRRAGLALSAEGIGRFGTGAARVASLRGSLSVARERLSGQSQLDPGLLLTDYPTLELCEAAAGFDHVVLVDPAASSPQQAAASGMAAPEATVHAAWGEQDRQFALTCLAEWRQLRPALVSLYRDLRERAPATVQQLQELMRDGAKLAPAAELCGLRLAVLSESGLIGFEPADGVRLPRVLSSERTDLELSPTYRALGARYEREKRFLQTARHQ